MIVVEAKTRYEPANTRSIELFLHRRRPPSRRNAKLDSSQSSAPTSDDRRWNHRRHRRRRRRRHRRRPLLAALSLDQGVASFRDYPGVAGTKIHKDLIKSERASF